MQQLKQKEEEYALTDQESVSTEGRFYLSALPFVAGQKDTKHLIQKTKIVGLPILNSSMKIKRIDAEKYFEEIIKTVTAKAAKQA